MNHGIRHWCQTGIRSWCPVSPLVSYAYTKSLSSHKIPSTITRSISQSSQLVHMLFLCQAILTCNQSNGLVLNHTLRFKLARSQMKKLVSTQCAQKWLFTSVGSQLLVKLSDSDRGISESLRPSPSQVTSHQPSCPCRVTETLNCRVTSHQPSSRVESRITKAKSLQSNSMHNIDQVWLKLETNCKLCVC